MMRTGLWGLLSHWWRNPMQLAMLLLGLSLATALWSGVQSINAEARASYARAATAIGQDGLARLVSTDGALIPDADYVALRRAGWMVSPVIEGRIPELNLRIIGIEPLTLPATARRIDIGEGILDFIDGAGVLFVSAETAARLADADLPPLQIADLPDGIAMTDISVAQRLLGAEGLSHLIVSPDQAGLEAELADITPGLTLRRAEPSADLARLTDSFHLNLTAFGMLAFTVGLFIVHSAIGLAFEQRRSVFRTLRALGLSTRALTGLLTLELLVLSLVGGLAGVGLGYGVAAALLPDVAATLRGLYGAEVSGALSFRPGWWAAGIGIAVVGTFGAAAHGLWRVWHMPLLAPSQPQAWAMVSARVLRWQSGLGLGLLGAALIIGLTGQGLWSGFGVLGGLLLGAALLLPVFLSMMIAVARRLARGVLAQWFWADTQQQLPGLSLALMALLLALAANVGVGTMVDSFRLTFTGWLDQRLASEIYVTAQNAGEAERMLIWLAPRTTAVLPIVETPADLAGQPGELIGLSDHATYRDNWPLLVATPDAWRRIAGGTGVMVNEQLYRRAGIALGETLILPGGALQVVGVYSDYGNPRPQALIAADLLTARFPTVQRLRFGLRVDPALAGALAVELRAEFALPENAVIDQAGIKAFSLGIFERTFAVTGALNALTLGVAGLAMFASLLTLSGMRLPQLAPVWAMGLTRRRLAALDFARTLLLAGFTFAAALPLGMALAWVLLAVVNVAAFGWRLPMHVFPADWLRLGGLALLVAAIAALIPVRKLARLDPADLLRVFANER